jgi:hypothetical protein
MGKSFEQRRKRFRIQRSFEVELNASRGGVRKHAVKDLHDSRFMVGGLHSGCVDERNDHAADTYDAATADEPKQMLAQFLQKFHARSDEWVIHEIVRTHRDYGDTVFS